MDNRTVMPVSYISQHIDLISILFFYNSHFWIISVLKNNEDKYNQYIIMAMQNKNNNKNMSISQASRMITFTTQLEVMKMYVYARA